jgi:lytic murein transglycosylase
VPPASTDAPTPAPSIPFEDWLQALREEALQRGIRPETVQRALSGLEPVPQILERDRAQAEFSLSLTEYFERRLTRQVLDTAKKYVIEHRELLASVQAKYGVQMRYLVSVWALESNFGRFAGVRPMMPALATLAYDPRRGTLFRQQLFDALTVVDKGYIELDALKGSWAGAMGQPQFMPSSYLEYAQDFDGDGRRDIWGSDSDSLASAANLLKKGGWKPGVGWAKEVILPAGFDYGLAEGPREVPSWWEAKGVKRADGLPWTAADAASPAGLILPAGWSGPAFLALPNHFAIRTYNNSTSYALGIGLLADRFAGGGPLVAAWPVETPLSLADRMAAQIALGRLGFDPGPADGVVGAGTRKALRAWQADRKLPADGYLSSDMVARLKAQAGIS